MDDRPIEIRLKGDALAIRSVLAGGADLMTSQASAAKIPLMPLIRPEAHFDEFTFANAHTNDPVTNIVYCLHSLDPEVEPYVHSDPETAHPKRGFWCAHSHNALGAVKIEIDFVLSTETHHWEWALPFESFEPYGPDAPQGWWINEVNVGYAFDETALPFAFIRLARQGEAGGLEGEIVTADNFPNP